MGSSEHPFQQHRSGWPLCAIWDPYVAGDQKSQLANPRSHVGGTFFGRANIEIDQTIFSMLFLVAAITLSANGPIKTAAPPYPPAPAG